MNLGDEARKAYHTLLESRGRVNILIAGRVGVGKSTLVNAVFQGNLTATGQGRPVTPNTREICKEGVPVCIFDTRGMEMADFQKTLQALETLVHTRRAELDPHRHIHVAWICIAEDLRRVESAEISLVDMLAKYMPVMAVITKARADQGFKQVVQDLLPAARNVTRVRALEETFDDGHVLPAMGLQELVTATMEVVPEGHRNAFAAAQKVSIDLKKSQAHKAVASAVLLAGAAAASPIPLSDAALLVPIQVGMLAGITLIFGVPIEAGFLSALVASAVGSAGTTVAGRIIVAGLLKLIPGAGTLTGPLISAGAAVTLTTTLGEAYIAVLAMLFESRGGEPPSPEAIVTAFQKELRQSR
jgi:uncharacterized protein (DUF697 family)/predicted GTPase